MKEKVAECRSDNGIIVRTLMGVDLQIEGFLSMMNVVSGDFHPKVSSFDDLGERVHIRGGLHSIDDDGYVGDDAETMTTCGKHDDRRRDDDRRNIRKP